jgi:alkylated DNA repair dioxygenase AlkB
VDLFQNPATNLLPYDGVATYHGRILPDAAARDYYDTLRSTVPWKHDEIVIFGKHIVTAREVAWYGDPGLAYTYSGSTKQPLPWTKELLELKSLAEHHTALSFNSCLLNLYHDGSEGMGWHSDDEKTIVKNSGIASLSFGAERRFAFRHKQTKETVSLLLEHGSLLLMAGTTQTHWQHRLPTAKKITTPRINLTFRMMLLPPAPAAPPCRTAPSPPPAP